MITVTFEIAGTSTVPSAVQDIISALTSVTSSQITAISAGVEDDEDDAAELVAAD